MSKQEIMEKIKENRDLFVEQKQGKCEFLRSAVAYPEFHKDAILQTTAAIGLLDEKIGLLDEVLEMFDK